jgi:hypothetical protein
MTKLHVPEYEKTIGFCCPSAPDCSASAAAAPVAHTLTAQSTPSSYYCVDHAMIPKWNSLHDAGFQDWLLPIQEIADNWESVDTHRSWSGTSILRAVMEHDMSQSRDIGTQQTPSLTN